MPSPPMSPVSQPMNRNLQRSTGAPPTRQRATYQEPGSTDYVVADGANPALYSPHRTDYGARRNAGVSSLPYMDPRPPRPSSADSVSNKASAPTRPTAPVPARTDTDESQVDPHVTSPSISATVAASQTAPVPLLTPPPRMSSQPLGATFGQLTARATQFTADTLEVEIRGMQPHQAVVIRLKNGP